MSYIFVMALSCHSNDVDAFSANLNVLFGFYPSTFLFGCKEILRFVFNLRSSKTGKPPR